MDYMIIIFLGFAIGFLSSFFGIGGGSLMVPVLYLLYPRLPASIIIPVSLGTIFIITTINTTRFYKLGLLPPKNIIKNFFITCSIGGLLGANLLYITDTATTKKIMGIVIFISMLKIVIPKSINRKTTEPSNPSGKLMATTGFLGSLISSLTGLGGGIVFTPMLINIVKLPLKMVTPYSNLAMMVATFIGVIPHLFKHHSQSIVFESEILNGLFVGNVNFGIILILVVGAFVSSKLGIKFNSSISEKKKKYILSSLLLVLSVKMIFY